jgi:T-complex protein 1 subunit epsilon
LDKGLHPLKIADGFDIACDISLKKLEEISEEINISDNGNRKLIEAAMTALGSKVLILI